MLTLVQPIKTKTNETIQEMSTPRLRGSSDSTDSRLCDELDAMTDCVQRLAQKVFAGEAPMEQLLASVELMNECFTEVLLPSFDSMGETLRPFHGGSDDEDEE